MLSVGEHIRMPRVYRGRDIQWWMQALGILDERYDAVDDIVRARRVPSPQLVGTPQQLTLDLNSLRESGVEIVGRVAGIAAGKLQFSGSLKNQCAMADLKLGRLLDGIDDWIGHNDMAREVGAAERLAPTKVEESPRLFLDLGRARIDTVIWATGFRPDYGWLQLPVFDRRGRLRHDGGVVDAPGIYTLGLNFMRRRKSSFMHGAEDDVRELGDHLVAHLRGSQQELARNQPGYLGSGIPAWPVAGCD
jgi:putative flavoprotein involved in K+ transport